MKNKFMLWFVRLVRRDMEEFQEDQEEKKKVYEAIRRKNSETKEL